jgi:hypothetical protein
MEQAIRAESIDPTVADAQGKEIRCPDGTVGEVADVLVDPVTERPSYLVWREAVVVTKEVSIPIDYVERVEGNRIVLRVKRDVIERLPHFWMADRNGSGRPQNY